MKSFQIIQDTRFSNDPKNEVLTLSNTIYEDLKNIGAIVYKEPIRELTFKDNDPCKSYRIKFYIDKYSTNPTFKTMQKVINKTKAVCLDNVKDKSLTLTFNGLIPTN